MPKPKNTPTKKVAEATSSNQKKTPKKKTAVNSADSLNYVSDIAPYTLEKNEEYMHAKQEHHFRNILVNWRNELMQEVDRTVSHMQEDALNYPDPTDRATREEEFSLELRTRERERRLLNKITNSLNLLNSHDYGWCSQCGIEIGIRRLEIRPTATLCVDCKSLDEIKERQTLG